MKKAPKLGDLLTLLSVKWEAIGSNTPAGEERSAGTLLERATVGTTVIRRLYSESQMTELDSATVDDL